MGLINKGTRNEYRRSTRPEPILPGKHALNPPIVTVIGAGVAGLTAAHELVERGFLVQVVEATPDPYYPGRPVVGGMAANQRARVRANLEDLHQPLLRLRRDTDAMKKVLAEWLLWLFTLNRTRWIQTEEPAEVSRQLSWSPSERGYPNVIEQLRAGKESYRRRWLWDLTIRGALLDAIKRVRGRSAPEVVTELFGRWSKDASTAEIIRDIHKYMSDGDTQEVEKQWGIELPSKEAVETYMSSIIGPAIEREFLCFRLVPRAVRGIKDAEQKARDLYEEWVAAIARDPELKHCMVDLPYEVAQDKIAEKAAAAADEARVVEQGEPLTIEPDKFPNFWVQVEFIEQRLPGEHGYRFFPSFYRHLDDTMRRIPLCDDSGRLTGQTVFDNLRPTVFQGLGMSADDLKRLEQLNRAQKPAKPGDKPIEIHLRDLTDDPDPACASSRSGTQDKARVVEIHRNRAKSIEGFRNRTDRFVERLGGTKRDAMLFFAKMLRYMTSCPERRRKSYEGDPWSKFVGMREKPGDDGVFSPAMEEHMKAAAQALLAFSVGEADTRTYGNVATQLFLDQFEDGTRTDRTLNGPTSAAWLEPWRDYLERQGVRFFCKQVTGLTLVGEELVPVFNDTPDEQRREEFLAYDPTKPESSPDFYVLALSLPQASRLLQEGASPEVRAAVGSRPDLEELRKVVRLHKYAADGGLKDMTGLQFFFDAKTSIGRGHMYFPLSDWGLSSISQSEFWLTRGGFSDGYVGVLSVDVCTTGDMKTPSTPERPSFWDKLLRDDTLSGAIDQADADDRGRFAVAHRAWDEIDARIDKTDKLAEPRCFHLDRTISADGNGSKFLASTPALRDRPGRTDGETCVGDQEIKYGLHFKRWVLCGTFMATHTRMTTMEAANESARHAVRTIVDCLGRPIERHNETLVIGLDVLQVDALANRMYNGAWQERPFDPPDIWNPENYEMEDLDLFRRIDRRLVDLELPHFMDIIDFDRKLKHALEAADIYEDEVKEVNLGQLLGLAASSADAAATKEFGRGYRTKVTDELKRIQDQVEKVTGKAGVVGDRFPDLRGMLAGDLQKLVDKLK